jgi:hypothetical protein
MGPTTILAVVWPGMTRGTSITILASAAVVARRRPSPAIAGCQAMQGETKVGG